MNKLMLGDCLGRMKEIPDGSVDMVLCDLPYGCTGLEWDKVIDGDLLFAEYKRICKQNANVLLFCQIEFAKYLMDSTFKSEFSHSLIWVKNNKTRHLSAKSNLCTYNSVIDSDVLYAPLTEKRVHPTQKPVNLLERLLLTYSNVGDTVLGNCMGSGSTGVACAKTSRNFIGIELDPGYFQIAQHRIEEAQEQTKITI